jgi:hypothetical protein
MRVCTLPAGEVAYMLRRDLGPQRAWSDFLTDCIQGKTNFHGLVLLPVACIHRKGSRRPAYLKEDVFAFVRQALAVSPPPSSNTKGWQVDIVDLDPSDLRPWRSRVVVPVAL